MRAAMTANRFGLVLVLLGAGCSGTIGVIDADDSGTGADSGTRVQSERRDNTREARLTSWAREPRYRRLRVLTAEFVRQAAP